MQRLLLIALFIITGCTSVNSNYYTDHKVGFSLNLPSGWEYNEDGSKEVSKQANMESGSQGKGIMFTEPKYDPFGHMMFVIIEPSKEAPKSEAEIAVQLKSLKERFGSKASYSRVKNINGYTAVQLIAPQTEYEAHSCFFHCTRIFTGEKMFEMVFLVSDSFRDRYEKVFDNCVESFKVIK